MRIIAGKKKGMRLLSPNTNLSRPISDRVKESLFSILCTYGFPEGKIVADLFCGVGSLGLEAISRGAEFVTFVEKNRQIISTLRKNIERAGFTKKSKVFRANAFTAGAPAGRDKYDLVFVDPPYAATKDVNSDSPLAQLLDLLTEQLAADGLVVVRTEKSTQLPAEYGRLKTIERRQWGTMAITFLKEQNQC